MNSRQRAKQAARKVNPVQEAWNVVADHLLSVEAVAPCFFIGEEGWSKTRKCLSLTSIRGFKLVSKPLGEVTKKWLKTRK